MRFTKSLLLGSSAALLAVAGAQAADLPSRKAAPVEYVRVCDAYGEGFYWIPGTDTCLRVGGRVRVDGWYTPSKNAVSGRSTGGGTGTFISSNAVDSTGWYARGIVNMDARTQSAWGTVQTVFSLRLQAASGLGVASPGYTGGGFSGGNANTAAPGAGARPPRGPPAGPLLPRPSAAASPPPCRSKPGAPCRCR